MCNISTFQLYLKSIIEMSIYLFIFCTNALFITSSNYQYILTIYHTLGYLFIFFSFFIFHFQGITFSISFSLLERISFSPLELEISLLF